MAFDRALRPASSQAKIFLQEKSVLGTGPILDAITSGGINLAPSAR